MSYTATSGPIFRAPTGPPDWSGDDGYEELKRHMQTAVILELYTIPLYLFAAYSIKGDSASTTKIINVVEQEMLHLALSGNVLTAIGGEPKIYGKEFTPQYPVEIFFDKTLLELKPATRKNVETFQRLEEPLRKLPIRAVAHILPEYQSIGEFYSATIDGLTIVNEKYQASGRELFLASTYGKQFNSQDGSWDSDQMEVIQSLESAKKSLTLVIEQGEGSTGKEVKNAGPSHYEVFTDLLANHDLDCWPVVENPKTSDFVSEIKIYSVMLLSDAAYSYLLWTIQVLWTYEGSQREELITNNMMNIMMSVIRPLTLYLVTQTMESGKHAASPFNFYEFSSIKTAHEELVKLAANAIEHNGEVKELLSVKQTLEALVDISVTQTG